MVPYRANASANMKKLMSASASLRRMRRSVKSACQPRPACSRRLRFENGDYDCVFDNTMKSTEWRSCESCHKSYLSPRSKHCGKRCQMYNANNNMDPGPVPNELSGLTYVEQQLIARVHPVMNVYKIKGHQIGYSGNVINFPQEVTELASKLPHRVHDLTSLLVMRVKQANEEGFVEFHVRAKKVQDALIWLKLNNQFYRDIEISQENLSTLPEDGNVWGEVRSWATECSTNNETVSEDSSGVRYFFSRVMFG